MRLSVKNLDDIDVYFVLKPEHAHIERLEKLCSYSNICITASHSIRISVSAPSITLILT